jgi:hypothetical protein
MKEGKKTIFYQTHRKIILNINQHEINEYRGEHRYFISHVKRPVLS